MNMLQYFPKQFNSEVLDKLHLCEGWVHAFFATFKIY